MQAPNDGPSRSLSAPVKTSVGSHGVLFSSGAVVLACLALGVVLGMRSMQRGLADMYAAEQSGPLAPAREAERIKERATEQLRRSAGNAQHGRELFSMSCFVCHGPTGSGVTGLGANLRGSRFVADRDDRQLVTFIKMGRLPGDHNSVMNLTMPPKGGNPALDDRGLLDIVAYIRTLQAGG
jgi:mono/diheme cytochrome c family protein